MKPSVWGKHYWFVFHIIGLKYPEVPSLEDKLSHIHFYKELWRFIPCNTCSTNYQIHYEQFPVDDHLETNETLFKWTVDFHNIVNTSLSKPIMGLNDAMAQYSSSQEVVLGKSQEIKQCDHHLAINTMLYINAMFIVLTAIFIVWVWNKNKKLIRK